jgi:hypothetical protein
MRDRPDAATLIALARAAEARGTEPSLVTRSLAIAERERQAGTASVEAIRILLVGLWGEGTIGDLLCRLAQEIHAGAYDAAGPAREEIRRVLWAITLQKLRESNPDYLVREQIEAAL